jgi:hypothetical protein
VHVWERVLVGVVLALALALALAGCDTVYGLNGRDDDDPSNEVGLECAGYELDLDDTFSDPSPCAPWGESFEDSSHRVYTSGGSLFIEADVPGAGGCARTSSVPFPRAMIMEVSSVIDVGNGYTFVSAGSDDALKAMGNELRYENKDETSNYGHTPWEPNLRYWRLEQRDEFRIGSYSTDGTTWTELGRRRVPASNVILGIVAGLADDSPNTGTAQIERLVVCR